MRYWSGVQGIGQDKTVAFTDGTKVQIEQALVANGLGAAIARDGLLGPGAESVAEGGADSRGRPRRSARRSPTTSSAFRALRPASS